MNVYLAARYSRRLELVEHQHELEGYGGADAERVAAEDIDDLRRAEVLVAFTEPPRSSTSRGGRHVEFGYALALGYPILVVGPREHVFCCLVDQVDEWHQAMPWLAARIPVATHPESPA